MNDVVTEVTARIERRSESGRASYLARMDDAALQRPARQALGCGNLAHGLAACGAHDKARLRRGDHPNVAIVTSYNDMLSAHQPLATYPAALKRAVLGAGGVAQVAGGVPAMCDGITQGRPGMELSLFSRDVVALSTAIALAHDMFDGTLLLGVCDKIVPGLLIGALAFGHLPSILVSPGPMPSGLSNVEKSRVRRAHADGRVDRGALLDAEMASYHAPGTCTFYGTANANQLLVEAMGLQLPGAGFVNPGTPLRKALTAEAARRVTAMAASRERAGRIGEIVDERAIVNAMVALLATGGSTNHTIHLVAIAAAAGITVGWDDFAALSRVVPLLARIYPNGSADVNDFHAAGGTAALFGSLLDAGLLHADVGTIVGDGLERYRLRPGLDEDGALEWAPVGAGGDDAIIRSADRPFAHDGGLRVLDGSLGRAVVKVSAVDPAHLVIRAPARVFDDQAQLTAAFERDELDGDFVAVVRYQGPRANGMPELHSLVPALSVLLGRGQRVALVTDGRMSGASGTVPAAIHCTPEAAAGGPLSLLHDGDVIELDCERGTLEVIGVDLDERAPVPSSAPSADSGSGRELFATLRELVGTADHGASILSSPGVAVPA